MGAMEPEIDTARIHLQVFGQDQTIELQVRVGPCSVSNLLPPARELSRRVSALAVAQAEVEGRSVSCREGCAACCRHLIGISSVEALALAGVVGAMPPERQRAVRARFTAAVARMEDAGLLDPVRPRGNVALLSRAAPGESTWAQLSRRYFEERIDCPFLEGERCGIYDERPMVCREYQVTTPSAWCATLNGDVRDVERPFRMSEVLGSAAGEIAGIDGRLIPIPMVLEWAEAQGSALSGERDGEAMFWVLLRHIDAQSGIPFDERPGGDGEPV